jgi:5-aminolevulinate synthase
VQAAADELLPRRYPAVRRGTERLRLTLSPLHSDADIKTLVAGLSDVWNRNRLILRRGA